MTPQMLQGPPPGLIVSHLTTDQSQLAHLGAQTIIQHPQQILPGPPEGQQILGPPPFSPGSLPTLHQGPPPAGQGLHPSAVHQGQFPPPGHHPIPQQLMVPPPQSSANQPPPSPGIDSRLVFLITLFSQECTMHLLAVF